MSGGYIRNRIKGHPYTPDGFRYRHRVVMSEKLKRKLKDDEEVHHKDHDKRNNDPDNLELTTKSAHARMHTHTVSPEVRALLSKKLVGNKNGLGSTHTAEERARISLRNKKNWAAGVFKNSHSPEAIAKSSRTRTGMKRSPHTEETKEKIRQTKRNRKLADHHAN